MKLLQPPMCFRRQPLFSKRFIFDWFSFVDHFNASLKFQWKHSTIVSITERSRARERERERERERRKKKKWCLRLLVLRWCSFLSFPRLPRRPALMMHVLEMKLEKNMFRRYNGCEKGNTQNVFAAVFSLSFLPFLFFLACLFIWQLVLWLMFRKITSFFCFLCGDVSFPSRSSPAYLFGFPQTSVDDFELAIRIPDDVS